MKRILTKIYPGSYIRQREKKGHKRIPIKQRIYTFHYIHSTNLSSRKLGYRFSKEQLIEMKMLIRKLKKLFIRKTLKIPPSTFSRLKREIDKDNWRRNKIVSSNDSRILIDSKNKKYVEWLVHPPTVLITMKDIKKFIDNAFESDVKAQDTRGFLSKEWKYNYKRGISHSWMNKKKIKEFKCYIFKRKKWLYIAKI